MTRWGMAVTVLGVVIWTLAGCGGTEEEERKPFRVGVASLQITPKKTGLYLAGWGHNRAFTKVHDDIYARAIAFERGGTTVVWVSLDLVGLLAPDVGEIRERVEDVPPDHILICCTHVHSAPDVVGLWGPSEDVPGVDEEYRKYVKDRTVEAIKRALRSMRTARIRLARTQAPPNCAVNHDDPEIIDPEISILQAVNPAGEPIATVVNWACHPECLDKANLEVTSDYVHWLREVVESQTGGICIFFNGALGGMVSPACKEHSFAEAERIGRAVGDAVVKALKEAEEPMRPDLAFASTQVRFPIESPRLLKALKAGLLVPYKNFRDKEVTADIAVMWLGPSIWMTFPGEPLPALGLKAKSMAETDYKFLISLANNEVGYIIPTDQWGQKRYEYEMSMSLGPKTAGICLNALSELLAEAPAWAKPEKSGQQSGEKAKSQEATRGQAQSGGGSGTKPRASTSGPASLVQQTSAASVAARPVAEPARSKPTGRPSNQPRPPAAGTGK
ncbi:MAG: hypothetical protein H5T86_05220 [Armatimonadetes bacterium]|nr:hypothetical protein [Armatimonadota bacterium]